MKHYTFGLFFLLFTNVSFANQIQDFLFYKYQKPVKYAGASDNSYLYFDPTSIEKIKNSQTMIIRMIVAGIQFKDIKDPETKSVFEAGRRTYLEIMFECETRKTIILTATSYKLFGQFESHSKYNIDEIEVRYFNSDSPLYVAGLYACNQKTNKFWSLFFK